MAAAELERRSAAYFRRAAAWYQRPAAAEGAAQASRVQPFIDTWGNFAERGVRDAGLTGGEAIRASTDLFLSPTAAATADQRTADGPSWAQALEATRATLAARVARREDGNGLKFSRLRRAAHRHHYATGDEARMLREVRALKADFHGVLSAEERRALDGVARIVVGDYATLGDDKERE